MLIALHCSSKVQKEELLKHFKPDTIKAICECVINIINKNIKVNDQEKRKIKDIINPYNCLLRNDNFSFKTTNN